MKLQSSSKSHPVKKSYREERKPNETGIIPREMRRSTDHGEQRKAKPSATLSFHNQRKPSVVPKAAEVRKQNDPKALNDKSGYAEPLPGTSSKQSGMYWCEK